MGVALIAWLVPGFDRYRAGRATGRVGHGGVAPGSAAPADASGAPARALVTRFVDEKRKGRVDGF